MPAEDIVSSHPEGAALTIWVVPGARRTETAGLHGDALKIRIAAPPEKGRANEAVGIFLTDLLASPVRLLSGVGSRRKRYLVRGVGPADLIARIEDLLD